MNITLAQVATGVAGLSMAVAGWFASQQSMLSSRVDTVETQAAATSQAITDIDARTTRIENKLDAIIINSKQ